VLRRRLLAQMTMMAEPIAHNADIAPEWFLRAMSTRVRTMREFAEQEIILPNGEYEGLRFRCDRQPYSGLFFDAHDSGNWTRFVVTGPTQSGKTLCAFVIPILYYLFEMRETVVCGLPNEDIRNDKWELDLLPVIERTQYRKLLPVEGSGSRRGRVGASIRFRNGATLRFMTAGGGDKQRASFTTRIVVITETDGFDAPGATSREADKVTQIINRTGAFDRSERARIFLECTVTVEEGRTWQEYNAGTASRIACPCPACGDYVTPGREHLHGWQDAASEEAARRESYWVCPSCGVVLSEDERTEMCAASALAHKGQEIDSNGVLHGDNPDTTALGFRWSAFDNQFASARSIGAREWRAARAIQEENAEKEMRQFVWALPYEPPRDDLSGVTIEAILSRTVDIPRGHIPKDTEYITMGCDIGKRLLHWVVLAWRHDASPHTVEYAVQDVAVVSLGEERGLLAALQQIADMAAEGWPIHNTEIDDHAMVDSIWVDARYQTDTICQFVRETGPPWHPVRGWGESQDMAGAYRPPGATNKRVVRVGQGYHWTRDRARGVRFADVNADQWKTFLHARLTTPPNHPGAMTLYHVGHVNEHMTLAKHWTSERQIEEFRAGKGNVTLWERVHRRNHYFDAAYMACAAAHSLGVRLIGDKPKKVVVPETEAKKPDKSGGWTIGRG